MAWKVYHQFEFVEAALDATRPAFSDARCFEWFRTYALGQICHKDELGVSSAVRALGTDANSYNSMLHIFRSEAWSSGSLGDAWRRFVAAQPGLARVGGRLLLDSDGVKVSKEGKRMPGVKIHHQESGTSSKAEWIFGHLFGGLGVVFGEPGSCCCVPLTVDMQDGMRTAAGWEEAEGLGISGESHPVQSVRRGFEGARALGEPCLLAMDRYFLGRPALAAWLEESGRAVADGLPEGLVHIVTKAKSSAAFWFDPPERVPGRPGRPRKRGDKFKVAREADGLRWETVEVRAGGGERTRVRCATLDLLWGEGLYVPVRLVVVREEGRADQYLVCTDRTMAAADIIEAYVLRWEIEVTFRDMKQEVMGFSYHFWSKSMPELAGIPKKGQRQGDALEGVDGPDGRAAVLRAYEAIERHVAVSCVACGILQLLALREPEDGEVACATFTRTPKARSVSPRTVRVFLRDRVSLFLACAEGSEMAEFCREHAVGEGGYRPKGVVSRE